jgi:hypothetical protein
VLLKPLGPQAVKIAVTPRDKTAASEARPYFLNFMRFLRPDPSVAEAGLPRQQN